MRNNTIYIFFFLLVSFNLLGQESPFGTGQINNQNIGLLEDISVVVPSQSGFGFVEYFPDAQQLLQDYNFDIYVPDSYDGSEAYGLVTFINSGNNGGFKSQWLPVLDDKKLIWIAGDNIGNSININIRMGAGMAAALRMLELFNIDTDRIYTSGNSGGARMAHNLAFIYPEIFDGAMPSCGGSYIREVEQDYETQNPDSHYEAILPYAASYLDYLLPFDQRFANMTSFDDFREGDIMNIYHNGSEQDGFKSKFLETSGGHCSTTTEHFMDAVNFVEHPFIEVINEGFDGSTQLTFKTINAELGNNSTMELSPENLPFSQIQSRDLFLWNDPKGAILETSIHLDPNAMNMNASFNMGIWSMEKPLNYCGFIGTQLMDDIPGILFAVDFGTPQPTLSVSIENPDQPELELLFSATLTEWDVNEPLPIKYHLWDKELRIELGAHVSALSPIIDGVKLLDDSRSIRIRWNDIATDFWGTSAWVDGAFLTLTFEGNDSTQLASKLLVDMVGLIVAEDDIASQIPMTTVSIQESICQGESFQISNNVFSDSGTYSVIMVNSVGCDSIVVLDLLVNPIPLVTITEVDGILTANAGFESYQWYLDGMVLDGETESILTVTENGDYYVVVSNESDCLNASDVITYLNTSVESITPLEVNVFPNPTYSDLFINVEGSIFKAELFDLMGRRLKSNLGSTNDISNLINGIYILVINLEERTIVYRIEKRE